LEKGLQYYFETIPIPNGKKRQNKKVKKAYVPTPTFTDVDNSPGIPIDESFQRPKVYIEYTDGKSVVYIVTSGYQLLHLLNLLSKKRLIYSLAQRENEINTIEYDLDPQDEIFLETLNSLNANNKQQVTEIEFEELFDLFEKECFNQVSVFSFVGEVAQLFYSVIQKYQIDSFVIFLW
jgi:hypothetical protein